MTSWIFAIWSSSLAPGKRGCRLDGRDKGLLLGQALSGWLTPNPLTPSQAKSRGSAQEGLSLGTFSVSETATQLSKNKSHIKMHDLESKESVSRSTQVSGLLKQLAEQVGADSLGPAHVTLASNSPVPGEPL